VGVALAVALERRPSTVRTEAVDLDDQAGVTPKKIDRERADPWIHLGLGEAMAAAKGEKAGLELAPCVVRIEVLDREAQILRLPQRLAELRLGENATEVDKGPRRRRDGDAGAPGRLTPEGAGAMHLDSLPAPRLVRHRDVCDEASNIG
jgi:hypothetical protein